LLGQILQRSTHSLDAGGYSIELTAMLQGSPVSFNVD
jgi:hypothetical protein